MLSLCNRKIRKTKTSQSLLLKSLASSRFGSITLACFHPLWWPCTTVSIEGSIVASPLDFISYSSMGVHLPTIYTALYADFHLNPSVTIFIPLWDKMCLLWSESSVPLKVKVFSHAASMKMDWELGHKLHRCINPQVVWWLNGQWREQKIWEVGLSGKVSQRWDSERYSLSLVLCSLSAFELPWGEQPCSWHCSNYDALPFL